MTTVARSGEFGPWRTPPDRPGQPGPGRPGGPDRPAVPFPAGAQVAPWLQEQLFHQRVVLLSGTVDLDTANHAVAALLALDTLGQQPVQLHLNASDGDLGAVFAIMDAMDAMRAPVHAVVTVQVGGGAVGVLVAARHRSAYPHARFRLGEPAVGDLAGTADQIAAAAGRHLRALEELVVRVAQTCGRPRSQVEDDFTTGRMLTAEEALEYGLIESIGRPAG